MARKSWTALGALLVASVSSPSLHDTAANHLQVVEAAVIERAVGQYVYYGCQTEATNARALAGAAFASDTMTLEICATNCAGFKYYGTEYGRECK